MSFEQRICEYADAHLAEYQDIALQIHAHPEVSNYEFFACKLLSEKLQQEGFTVQCDVAGHRTGFTASYKSAKQGPVLVFLAEYDALVGLGHGCGHNLFGATSLLAAVSLKQIIDEIGGEVRVYGTPGEEGGENGSAKGSFVREHCFDDVDAALCTHSSGDGYTVTTKSLGCAPVDIEFWGRSAHAASAPEKGINALDALIQVYNGINALRQHLTSDVRIHGIIVDGGTAPNVVPDYAHGKFYIRAATAPRLEQTYQKVARIVEGAALMTGAKGRMQPSQNRVENTVVTPCFDAVFVKRLKQLGYDVRPVVPEDEAASTDAGNVSQVVPTIQPNIWITESKTALHTEAFLKAACSEKGLNSIGIGAKAMALTGLDLIENPELLRQIKAEHAANVAAQGAEE